MNQNKHTAKAILSENISYRKDGKEIIVLKGQEILVDIFQSIALVNGEDHVDIYPEEYQFLSDEKKAV